jgi:predicted outer membrane protein
MAPDIGYFDTEEEAQKAIDKNKVSVQIHISLSEEDKEQLDRLADRKGKPVSKLVRELIRKEMQNG